MPVQSQIERLEAENSRLTAKIKHFMGQSEEVYAVWKPSFLQPVTENNIEEVSMELHAGWGELVNQTQGPAWLKSLALFALNQADWKEIARVFKDAP